MPDEPGGERDQEQRQEHRGREIGEFPQQRAPEDHAILALNIIGGSRAI
jgi:hypothetical protein